MTSHFLSHFSPPPAPLLRAQTGAAFGRGRPVTPAARVSILRRFPQSPRLTPRRGRPVTSAARAPASSGALGARAAALAPAVGPALLLQRVASARSSRAKRADIASRMSAASSPSMVPVNTSRGTHSSGVGPVCAWASSADAGLRRCAPRLLGVAAAISGPRWISSPPRGGSRLGRRQRPSAAASK